MEGQPRPRKRRGNVQRLFVVSPDRGLLVLPSTLDKSGSKARTRHPRNLQRGVLEGDVRIPIRYPSA